MPVSWSCALCGCRPHLGGSWCGAWRESGPGRGETGKTWCEARIRGRDGRGAELKYTLQVELGRPDDWLDGTGAGVGWGPRKEDSVKGRAARFWFE